MEFYEALSQYYDDIIPLGKLQINFLQKMFSGKEKILDLACGTGNYALALEEMGYKTFGLDIDEKMVLKAKEKEKGK
ncbi:class I SAM-dependent methyltransferase [Bacillota bacterium LX-D]|nr:class I SAM-dependent methyltransferase [Bacillota bacterium LX-D]